LGGSTILGKKTMNEKTNEIPTMREMLKATDCKGKAVTADAMYCQKDTSAVVMRERDVIIYGD
jgi:predicted transposase YbfD/YdcC